MDTTDPWIKFDEQGVCSHCQKVDEFKQSWSPEGDPAKYEKMLEQIRADGKGRDYDIIMGLSGGVDSSYVAYLAREAGLRTLVIHCDRGWNSELAVKNIENIVSKCGFDFITHVVDWEEMRDLQHAFFKSGVPNQDIPQDHAIAAVFYGYARKHKVKWSLSGSNLATESILPNSWGHDNLDITHLRAIHKQFGTKPLKHFPTMGYMEHVVVNQMLLGMKVARPLNYIAYNKSQAMETLTKEFDWRYYGGKHYESRFTKFFQSYYLPVRWGFDKRLAHLSSLVVSGEMTRDSALHEFKTGTLPLEEIDADKDYMARKLQISRDEFEALMVLPLKTHEEYPIAKYRVLNAYKSLRLAMKGKKS